MDYSYRLKTFACAGTTLSVRSMDKINICCNDGFDFARSLILDGDARIGIYTQDPTDTDFIVNDIFDEFCISPEIPMQIGYLLDNQNFNRTFILNSFVDALIERTKIFYDISVIEEMAQDINMPNLYHVTLDIYAQQKGLPMENSITLQELEELEPEDLNIDEDDSPMIRTRAYRRKKEALAKARAQKYLKFWRTRSYFYNNRVYSPKNSKYETYMKLQGNRLLRHMAIDDDEIVSSKGTAYKKLIVK